LTRTAKSGLPGDHHFYISFDTTAAGVSLSKRLKEKYPAEMTIVLQHRFWDLAVSDDRFEVKLTFDGIPERLVVPFAALKVFFDPSVRYGLQFEESDLTVRTHSIASNGLDDDPRNPVRAPGTRKPRAPKKPRADRDGDAAASSGQSNIPSPVHLAPRPQAASTPPSPAGGDGAPSKSVAEPPAIVKEPVADAAAGEDKPVPPAGGAEIVSLDKFRKK
jgi:hypothetical protein